MCHFHSPLQRSYLKYSKLAKCSNDNHLTKAMIKSSAYS